MPYASEEFTTFTRKGGFIALANYINSIDFFNNFSHLNIVGQKLKEFIREIIDSPAIVQYHENKLHLIFLARSKILDSIRLTYSNHFISHLNGALSC